MANNQKFNCITKTQKKWLTEKEEDHLGNEDPVECIKKEEKDRGNGLELTQYQEVESDYNRYFMECQGKLNIRRPNGINNKDRIQVPCGKCGICLSNRRAEWSIKIKHEFAFANFAKFITLTYDDQNLPIQLQSGRIKKARQVIREIGTSKQERNILEAKSTLDKKEIQRFLKLLRNESYKWYNDTKNKIECPEYGSKPLYMRYYLVGEYGTTTKRPHYHMIVFNVPNEITENIHKIWKYGNCHVGQVEEASIHYCTKYMINPIGEKDHQQKEFSLMSRKPAMGTAWYEKNQNYLIKNDRKYVINNGYKMAMPRIYKEKLGLKDSTYTAEIKKEKKEIEKWNKQNEYLKKLSKTENNPELTRLRRIEKAEQNIINNSKLKSK